MNSWVDIRLEPLTDTAEDSPIVNDRMGFLLQEISILFDTSYGEVLGDETFGSDFERFIWDLNVSNDTISRYVLDRIMNHTVSGGSFDIHVDTTISYGTESDIIIVKITIRDPQDNTSTNVVYRIS